MDRTAFESQFTATTAAVRDMLIKQAGVVSNALQTGVLTGAIGAGVGAAKAEKGHRLEGAIRGGIGGGVGGAALSGVAGHFINKTKTMQDAMKAINAHSNAPTLAEKVILQDSAIAAAKKALPLVLAGGAATAAGTVGGYQLAKKKEPTFAQRLGIK